MSTQKSDTESHDSVETKVEQHEDPVLKQVEKPGKESDPVRSITLIVLGVCVIFFVWHLVSDRYTPSTDQARVRTFVVPIAPKISGTVKQVKVDINQVVEKDELLLKIDPLDYEIAVQLAQANLDNAGQQIGVETADIQGAVARVSDNNAQLIKAQKDYARVRQIADVDPDLIAKTMLDSAQSEVEQATSRLEAAKADLEKARQQLGKGGQDNPKIRAALATLEQARLDLSRTTIHAPSQGYVTNVQIDIGHYAKAGAPLLTFLPEGAIWIQADMRENSIANIKQGDPVDILLDIAPGRIFKGEVFNIGFGVDKGQGGYLGNLPTLKDSGGWLRDAQRFPVLIKFSDDAAKGLRFIGGQADVIIYTGDNVTLNTLGHLWIRMLSIFSYVY